MWTVNETNQNQGLLLSSCCCPPPPAAAVLLVSKATRQQTFSSKHLKPPGHLGQVTSSSSLPALGAQQGPWESGMCCVVQGAGRQHCGRMRAWASSSALSPAGCVTSDGSPRGGLGGVWEGCVIAITPRSCQQFKRWTTEGCAGAAASVQAKFVSLSFV